MALDPSEYDPHTISRPPEIRAILHDLLTRRTLLRMTVPGRNVSIISTLLALDPEPATLWLDSATEAPVNRLLLAAPAVRLQGQLDGILIEFSGALRQAQHGGRPAFAMALPAQIRRVQRRQFFRVDVPASAPITCHIAHAGLPGGHADLPLCDISAGGLQLLDHDRHLAAFASGTIFPRCSLLLPRTAGLRIRLQLLRVSLRARADASPIQLAAFRYVDLDPGHLIAIQQYIGHLERTLLARRRGND